MLAHLSKTSPYVCDLNCGVIEPANRMASAPTKTLNVLLEQKESLQKSRKPLKLLGPDEVQVNTAVSTMDINASLQPVWYNEQTIVDDNHVQQEDIASAIREQQERSSASRDNLANSTLPVIKSDRSPINEAEEHLNRPLFMKKSSTFTIESSVNADSTLNDSEKENVIKDQQKDQVVAPSDDSFRALEHLLGLGSTTFRESIKNNHDTLSLTVVTPTDMVNSTRASARMSYSTKSGSGSLPSSQDIPTMPTIESITSTDSPSCLIDNASMEDARTSTTTNKQNSLDITEDNTIKGDSNNDDETNFSFELNDFPDNSKTESTMNVAKPTIPIRAPTCTDVAYRALIKPRSSGRISQPILADSPLAKSYKLRSSAPTSRMLRSSCRRISTDSPAPKTMNQEQPSLNIECFVNSDTSINTDSKRQLFEIVSIHEEAENEQEKSNSVTLNLIPSQLSQDFNQNASFQLEQISTPTKTLMPLLSREYTYNTPKHRSSRRRRSMLSSSTSSQQDRTIINEELNSPSFNSSLMLNILSTKPNETEQNTLTNSNTLSPVSIAAESTKNEETINSPSTTSKSMLNIVLSKPIETKQKHSSVRKSKQSTIGRESINSPSITSKSMLEILLTNPTDTEQDTLTNSGALSTNQTLQQSAIQKETTNSSSTVSKSMLRILLTDPTDVTENVLQQPLISSINRLSTRKSKRLSLNPTPRASINPLHSSTPSTSRRKSLQMVSIGEHEQVSTIVSHQRNVENPEEEQLQAIEMASVNHTGENIRNSSTIRTKDVGIQTTPSLDVSLRRRLNTMEQQTTPILQVSKSSSNMVVDDQQQITPIQSKLIMNLQRNVRFKLTPTTDARLAAKEKLEEALCGSKPDIIINPKPVITEPQQEIVKPVQSIRIKKKTKTKRKRITSTKKKVTSQKRTESNTTATAKKLSKQKVAKQISKVKNSKKKSELISSKNQKRQPVSESTQIENGQTSCKRSIPVVNIVPTAKRTKVSKLTETSVRTPNPLKIQNVATSNKNNIPESIERQSTTRSQSANEKNKTAQSIKRQSSTRSCSTGIKKNTSQSTARQTNERNRSTDNGKNISELTEGQPNTRNRPSANKKNISESAQLQRSTRNRSTTNRKNIAQTTERQLRSKPEPTNTELMRKTRKNKPKIIENKNEGKNIRLVPTVQAVELNQEERRKIEGLTIAKLKSRLNSHKEVIPKGVKKAELISLLIKIETNLLNKSGEAEIKKTVMVTRSRKKWES